MFIVVITSTSEAVAVRQRVGEGMGVVRGSSPLRLSEEQLVCLARHFQRRVRRVGGGGGRGGGGREREKMGRDGRMEEEVVKEGREGGGRGREGRGGKEGWWHKGERRKGWIRERRMEGRREGGGNKGVSVIQPRLIRFRYLLGSTRIDPEAIASTLEYCSMM